MKIKGKTQSDQSIIRMCGYITDDRSIAAYMGVDLKRVAYLRGYVNRSNERHAKAEKHREIYITWNNDAERKAAEDAKKGSAKLLKALVAFSANRQARINGGRSA